MVIVRILQMNRKILLLFCLSFVFTTGTYSQTERETRAVWVATNFRLDWPPQTYNQEKQKQALIEIFETVKSKNLNTVYFQAGSNGTVLFKSSFEPFSPYITGEVDGKADYDPLQFAVEQAHKQGLEIHAWINVAKCFGGTEYNILNNPKHISKRKPEWVIEDLQDGQKSYWLDPGLPEVREYIADMISEMVRNYDIDGVHLDYIRYPGVNFDDEFSYNVHGAGLSRAEFRRNNITAWVELINKKIKSVKHFIKLGAAPIGIYKNINGASGWEGYNEVYQDAREWLKRGIIDYVVPQIYWGFNDVPRFGLIARDWTENSYGRSVVLGIGAYKPSVKPDMDKMIQYGRVINADGVSFFRYENIKEADFASFRYKTYPASMSWLDGIYPISPLNLKYRKNQSKQGYFTLSWESQKLREDKDSIRYFALYNPPNPNSELLSEYLFDVIPADRNSVALAIDKPKRVNYYFTLKSVSKLWNESIESSNVISLKFYQLGSIDQADDLKLNPVLVKESDNRSLLLINSAEKENIEITGINGRVKQSLLADQLLPGKNILSLVKDISIFKSLIISFKSSHKKVELKF